MVVDNVLKLFFLFEISCPETRKKKKIVARIGIGGPSLDTELVNLKTLSAYIVIAHCNSVFVNSMFLFAFYRKKIWS